MNDAYNTLENQKSKSKNTNSPIFIKKGGGFFKIYLILFFLLTILFIILIITRTISINSYKVDYNKLDLEKIKLNNFSDIYRRHKDIIERSILEHTFKIEELKKENVTLQSKLTDLKDKNEELENKNNGIKNSNKGFKQTLEENNELKKDLEEKIKKMQESNEKIKKMIEDLED